MRMLVIGGTGFVGSHVVRALVASGHEITVFHRGETASRLPNSVSQVRGDRTRLDDYADELRGIKPHVVIDLAAYTEVDATSLMRTFTGVARRQVVSSSMDVYRCYGRLLRQTRIPADTPPDPPATEDSPMRESLFPYRSQAKSTDDLFYNYEKILVERAAQSYSDLPATVLRLPAVYGPHDKQHRTLEYLGQMDAGCGAITLGRTRAEWRWTRGYVENVAQAIVLAATDERATGRIYNVGEPIALAEAQWVRAIEDAADWTGEVRVVPDDELPATGPPYDWKQHCIGDSSRIRRELGFRETLAIEEGLRRTIAWERRARIQ